MDVEKLSIFQVEIPARLFSSAACCKFGSRFLALVVMLVLLVQSSLAFFLSS